MAHIDLRYVLKQIGLSGGLKRCEQALGLDRGDAAGLDGMFAVLLWHEYDTTGDPAALETLLAYNAADAVNLELLMVHAFNTLARDETPFGPEMRVPDPVLPHVEHAADAALVRRLKDRHGIWG